MRPNRGLPALQLLGAVAARWRTGRLVAMVAGVAALASLTGCFNPFDPRVFREGGTASTAPSPTSPENTMRLIQWCWTNRASDLYAEIFTADYEFQFGALDTTGNAYRDGILRRDDEVISFRNLCNGGGSEPPATSISLTIDPTLQKRRDARPGRQNKWHWTIETNVALTVRTENQSYETQGRGLYFFVRGDSALIPDDLAQAGIVRDSTRWWVDRWEDQTISTAGGLLAETLARAGNERIVSVDMRITPAGDWQPDGSSATTGVGAAEPTARTSARAAPTAPGSSPRAATGASTSLEYQQVSFGYIKSLFRRLQ